MSVIEIFNMSSHIRPKSILCNNSVFKRNLRITFINSWCAPNLPEPFLHILRKHEVILSIVSFPSLPFDIGNHFHAAFVQRIAQPGSAGIVIFGQSHRAIEFLGRWIVGQGLPVDGVYLPQLLEGRSLVRDFYLIFFCFSILFLARSS